MSIPSIKTSYDRQKSHFVFNIFNVLDDQNIFFYCILLNCYFILRLRNILFSQKQNGFIYTFKKENAVNKQ